MRKNLFILNYFFIFILICLFAADSSAVEIAVIKSRDIEPYNVFLSGFKKVVKGDFTEENMDGDIKKGVAIIDKIKSERPDLILTIGADASYIANQNIKDIPIVFSMVLNPEQYNLKNGNITGVSLDIPLRTQFYFYREILPDVKRVGIIYNNESTKKIADNAKAVAREFNIEIVALKVNDIKELPNAVGEIITKTDSLMLLFDTVVTSSQVVVQEIIILRSLQKKIPVVGFNKWSVSIGALYCLYSEYEDIGRQTGEMVNRILKGKELSFVSVETPRDIKVLFNEKVRDRIESKHSVNMPQGAYVWGGK